MAKVNRINVVFLYAKDMARLRRFYEQGFDLEKPHIDAKWWVEYEVGDGSHLALQQAEGIQVERISPKRGTVKFSVDVTDINAMTKKLKRLGATFHYEPRKEYGFYLAEFEDPDGNILRLYEKVKKA